MSGLPNGLYQFEALKTTRHLADFNGLLAAARQTDTTAAMRTWRLANADDGTVTLACVGSGRYLALADKDGFYYTLSADPEPWRLGPMPDGNWELIRAANDRRLWLSGIHFLDQTPVIQQGVDSQHDILPTRWVAADVAEV